MKARSTLELKEHGYPTFKTGTAYRAVRGDYLSLSTINDGREIGICEIKNKRDQQEDSVAIEVDALSRDFMNASVDERNTIMRLTFLKLQMEIDKNKFKQTMGSCVCRVTGKRDPHKVYVSTSYVGDSVAFVIVVDESKKIKFVHACNPGLHDGNNESEKNAITQGVGRTQGALIKVAEDEPARLNGTLGVTRALGDSYLDTCGISHQPDTIDFTFDCLPSDTVYMIAGCDGIMEHMKDETTPVAMFAESLRPLMLKTFKEQPLSAATIAKAIVENALQHQSSDNITAMVAPLLSNVDPITLTVFDGHGGSGIAEFLKNQFNYVWLTCQMEKENRISFLTRLHEHLLSLAVESNLLNKILATLTAAEKNKYINHEQIIVEMQQIIHAETNASSSFLSRWGFFKATGSVDDISTLITTINPDFIAESSEKLSILVRKTLAYQ